MRTFMRVVRSRAARWAFVLFAAALALWAVLQERQEVAAAFARLTPGAVLLAALATAVNLVLACLMWRSLLTDLGNRVRPVPAARIFFVGQLGKYVPGSLWPVVLQAELGHDVGVPRRRSVTAGVATILVAIASSAMLVLVTLAVPAALGLDDVWAVPDDVAGAPVVAVAALLLLLPLAMLHPAVLGRLMDFALRLAGREPMDHRLGARGVAAATGWGIASWVFAGLQVFVLARCLGAPAGAATAWLCIGAYCFAWAVGSIVVVAPAGVGAREFALAAVLAGTIGRGEALVVVLVSRVLFTVADLLAASLGVAAARRVHGHA